MEIKINIKTANEPILLQLVREEAEALKLHATKEEIDNLNIYNLIPSISDKCIYGQMTGNCFSLRAIELIQLCCNRVYKTDGFLQISSLELNGSPKEKNRYNYFSPIEVMIYNYRDNNANLISFLKGKTNILDLKINKNGE